MSEERTTAPAADLPTRIEHMPGALTVEEVRHLLGASRTYMYGQVAAGRIPYYRLPSGAIRLDPARVAQWLRDCEIAGERTRRAA